MPCRCPECLATVSSLPITSIAKPSRERLISPPRQEHDDREGKQHPEDVRLGESP